MKEPMSSRLVQRIAGAWLGLGLAGLTLLCSAEATAASALDTVQSFYDTLLITMRRGNRTIHPVATGCTQHFLRPFYGADGHRVRMGYRVFGPAATGD
jgi:hypothetical protein